MTKIDKPTLWGYRRTIRNPARKAVLEAVNEFLDQRWRKPLYMKHIQRAVCIARRHELVEPELLQKAGFNG
jgi:hypothetical protein